MKGSKAIIIDVKKRNTLLNIFIYANCFTIHKNMFMYLLRDVRLRDCTWIGAWSSWVVGALLKAVPRGLRENNPVTSP